ncbi:MAG: hypothetical protein R3A47_06965 [Polyangiales bacterium]
MANESITHEHAHILHLDNIGGFPAIINKVFGKTYSPNYAAPRWFIEGLATHIESAETSGGRLRSSIFDMYMRQAVLEDGSRVDRSFVEWDRSMAAWRPYYLHGSSFVRFIADRFGQEKIAEYLKVYGEIALTYGLNRVAKQVFGETFLELYPKWQEYLRERYASVQQRVDAEGRVMKDSGSVFHGETVRDPRFVDDHRIAYYVSDGRSDAQIRMLDLSTGKAKEVSRTVGEAYPSVRPNGDMY